MFCCRVHCVSASGFLLFGRSKAVFLLQFPTVCSFWFAGVQLCGLVSWHSTHIQCRETYSVNVIVTGYVPICIFFSVCSRLLIVGFLNSCTLQKTHYENMPIQIYWKFYHPKNENFQIKKFDIFHISAQNIDCGYSLEPPRRGGSNEYPQCMFWAEIRKIMYTPVNPSFTI